MDKKITIERKIGEGGFGEAFLVRLKDGGNRLVMKKISIGSADELRHAIGEAKVLKALDHPHIVRYVAAGADTTELGSIRRIDILMEYCERGDLAHLIAKQNGVRFPEEQVLRWFSQICSAVLYIHRHDVLHRDLKSENVFLTSENVIKVGDFGIATVLQNTMAKAKTICGTLACTAPEVWKNIPYDNKCDIWSLGCVLFEMVTLKKAFPQKKFIELAGIVSRVTIPVPTGCSEAVTNIIKKMLEYYPSKRSAIQDVINDLRQMLPEQDHPQQYIHAQCDACGDIVWNIRYKCLDCRNYDLCMSCERKGKHPDHGLLRMCGDHRSKWVHELCRCDECSTCPIRGIRFKCRRCPNYDLCEMCFNRDKHTQHKFAAICNP